MTQCRRIATDAEFRAAVRGLDAARVLIASRDWPTAARGLDVPGLYAWWVDDPGAADLSRGLGGSVTPGMIYAGQAGATKWPAGRVGGATLRSRISSRHLGGNIRGSTFRLALASVLAELNPPLNLGGRPSTAIREALTRLRAGVPES